VRECECFFGRVQALIHHLVGRHWRRKLEAGYPEEVAQVLQWFGDQPSEQRPFSIHSLCTVGQAHGCAPTAGYLLPFLPILSPRKSGHLKKEALHPVLIQCIGAEYEMHEGPSTSAQSHCTPTSR
jgi:hypothetical protein